MGYSRLWIFLLVFVDRLVLGLEQAQRLSGSDSADAAGGSGNYGNEARVGYYMDEMTSSVAAAGKRFVISGQ